MKAYKIEYFHPSEPDNIMEDEVKAKNEILLREILKNEGGYELKEFHEIIYKKNPLEKLMDWLNSRFSFGGYNEAIELIILKSFATSLQSSSNEQEALESAKWNFAKGDTKIRSLIDKLVFDLQQPGVSHVSDVFIQNEDIFSQNFILLMEQTKKHTIQTPLSTLISNQVDKKERGKKVEGYVELAEALMILKNAILSSIVEPLTWFFFTFGSALLIAIFLIPMLLDAMSKIRDISKDDYTPIGNSVLYLSHFITHYGIFILVVFVSMISGIIFLYNNNENFREKIHIFLLKMPIISDILSVFFTKKVTSLMAIYYQAGLGFKEIFQVLIPLIPIIPIKNELIYFHNRVDSENFDYIFNSYSGGDRFFTELFYMQLAKESNIRSEITGRYSQAFASILKNTDDKWDISLSRYPRKIGIILKILGFASVTYIAIGMMLILIKTTTNSI